MDITAYVMISVILCWEWVFLSLDKTMSNSSFPYPIFTLLLRPYCKTIYNSHMHFTISDVHLRHIYMAIYQDSMLPTKYFTADQRCRKPSIQNVSRFHVGIYYRSDVILSDRPTLSLTLRGIVGLTYT